MIYFFRFILIFKIVHSNFVASESQKMSSNDENDESQTPHQKDIEKMLKGYFKKGARGKNKDEGKAESHAEQSQTGNQAQQSQSEASERIQNVDDGHASGQRPHLGHAGPVRDQPNTDDFDEDQSRAVQRYEREKRQQEKKE
jgi:hypothetical protein